MSFESRLQARLQAAGEQLPGERIVFGEALDRAHRARRTYRFMVAVAGTAVVAGLAVTGWALTGTDGPRPLPPVESTPTPSPTPTPTPSEEYDDGLPRNFDAQPAMEAIDAFLAAAAESDANAMWDLMSDEARARFEDFAAFEEFAVAVNGETLGAWASATTTGVAYEGVELPGDVTAIVVTIFGEVTQEGSTSSSHLVVPVRISGPGRNRTVEIDAFTQGEFEVIATADGDTVSLNAGRPTRLPPDTAYEARTPEVASDARISLVYEFDEPAMPVAPTPTALEVTPDGSRARWHPGGALQGNYALVVTFVAEDGAIEVTSFRVRVTR